MPFQLGFAEPALLVAQRDPEASPGRDARALLLVESHALVGGPPAKEPAVHVGTSGWVYGSWRGTLNRTLQ